MKLYTSAPLPQDRNPQRNYRRCSQRYPARLASVSKRCPRETLDRVLNDSRLISAPGRCCQRNVCPDMRVVPSVACLKAQPVFAVACRPRRAGTKIPRNFQAKMKVRAPDRTCMMFTWCAGWLCGLHEHGASAQGCVVHEELLHCGGLEMSDIYLVPERAESRWHVQITLARAWIR